MVSLTTLQSQVTDATPSESITDTITVPLKYHDAVTSQGAIFRTLRYLGVEAELSVQPTRPSLPSRPSNSTAQAPRVDDVEDTVTEAHWEIVENYTEAEEGDSTWNLKARDQSGMDKAKDAIRDAIEKAKTATHVGFLTLPDRSSHARIVGAKGSNIARLHEMTNANIIVGRENSTIIITGSFLPSSLSVAGPNVYHARYRLTNLARSREGRHSENRPRRQSPEVGSLKIVPCMTVGNRVSRGSKHMVEG